MRMHTQNTTSRGLTVGWSNRILIAAGAGILFLTLFPFRFVLATKLPLGTSPFLLGRSPKVGGLLDILLNVLLFVPFGFGLAEKLREGGKSWRQTFAASLLAGAVFSYTIELLQIYIPSRDSGWEDVFTNSVGAVTGFFLFERWGHLVVRRLSEFDSLLTRWLTIPRTAIIILIYFVAWFAISGHLQKRSLLSNWDPNSLLVVGNNAQAEYPWRGQLLRVQFWDRALPQQLSEELTSGSADADARNGLVGNFDFSGPSLLQDQQRRFPDLVWTPRTPNAGNGSPLVLDGYHWLVSTAPVSDFVHELQSSNQFTVRVGCILGEVSDGDKRIVSISNSSGITNLTLRQEGTNLVFWFRNPLSVKRSLLAWYIPKVFAAIERHDILFSYDGANLSAFIDGRKESRAYQLSPGTALAQHLVRVTPGELDGYRYIYYALVFLPAGILMGLAARNAGSQPAAGAALLTVGVFIPPAILEWILVSACGRALSRANFLLSILLLVAGNVWINTDRRAN